MYSFFWEPGMQTSGCRRTSNCLLEKKVPGLQCREGITSEPQPAQLVAVLKMVQQMSQMSQKHI
jgi:hypothetical protein